MTKGRILAAAVALLAAAAVGATVTYLAVKPANTAAATPGPVASSTFLMSGSVTIRNDFAGSLAFPDRSTCQGGGGFSDLTTGTAVKVSDGTGHVVATGALNTGAPSTTTLSNTLVGDAKVTSACVLGFTVNDVPDGLSSYVVTVSHRGDRVVSPTEAHAGVELTIGS
ncbi:MAG TPA: hypothetical protein VGL64_25960 [Amycolatopsis sp.]|jgi:hypothetical protein